MNDFLFGISRQIDYAMDGFAHSLAYGIWGYPLLNAEEERWFRKSRSAERFMLKQFMQMSAIDEYNEWKPSEHGLAAWLPK